MIGSLYSGLTGLMGYQNAVDVTGNNIANQGTIAFKYSRAAFSSLFSENRYYASNNVDGQGNFGITSRTKRAGLGTNLSSIDTIMTSGIIENTGVFSDVAIGGNGFFFVGPNKDQNSESVAGRLYASKVGNFEKNMFPDLIQTSTGLALYGFLGKDDGNGNIVFDDIPTEAQMMDATQVEKGGFLDRLEPITLEDLQTISAKKTESIKFSGVLDTQVGPDKLVRMNQTDNLGTPYEVYFELSRDYSMLDSSLGEQYEQYELSIQVKDTDGNIMDGIVPESKRVVFSPNGQLLNESGDAISNLKITLATGNEINIEQEGLNFNYQSPRVVTYADIFAQTGDEDKLPLSFEKIEAGKWRLKPDLPQAGNMTKISLKGQTNEYILKDKDSSIIETDGIELGFDSTGKLISKNIVDTSGNLLEEIQGFVFTYEDGSQIEVEWKDTDLIESALIADVNATQIGGRSSGYLTNVEFSSDGYLLGNYSNKSQAKLAFIPLARFRSTEALASTSTDPLLYQIPVNEAGTPDINFFGYFKPGQGMSGNLVPYALEMSNVDISKEMVNLIKYQRAIQLNSRTVQTADQILQQAIQLKG
ncbi:MAG: flagellar hook protein FlgE [Thermotogaceae bacterium]|nr:flagellar hook protein FlgE [Thermotogaceae bacterium]